MWIIAIFLLYGLSFHFLYGVIDKETFLIEVKYNLSIFSNKVPNFCKFRALFFQSLSTPQF